MNCEFPIRHWIMWRVDIRFSHVKWMLPILMCALVGCGDPVEEELRGPEPPPEGEVLALYPAAVRFGSAPGLANRHAYEITGPGWDDAHVLMEDEVWRSDGLQDSDGVLWPTLDEPAPYTRSTPMAISASLVWRGADSGPAVVSGSAHAVLYSTTEPALGPISLGEVEFEATAVASTYEDDRAVVEYGDVSFLTGTLPDRVDLWRLEIRWVLRSDGSDVELTTNHQIPTSWRAPIPDAPLYREVVLWSAQWGAGEWEDYGPNDARSADMAHLISVSQLEGSRTLEDDGYSYGAFRRPPRDQIDDRVNVFLDFRRSACGEFRGLLMALIEFHGIDAYWIWFRFPELHPQKYSFYKTRMISAVGRETKNWYDTNHIIVGVGERVYDPTYTVHKSSWREYEDWMFEKYCLGAGTSCSGSGAWCRTPPEDEETRCIPNPPGWQDDWDLEVVIADNYK
jgi:hypothetical protein